MSIDLRNPAEWDFEPYFLERDHSNTKLLIGEWEARTALAYELCRELYFCNARMPELLTQISQGLLEDAVEGKYNVGAVRFLRLMGISPRKADFLPFMEMHSFVGEEIFSKTPWFSLEEDQRERWTISYAGKLIDEEGDAVPGNCRITVDFRWPMEEIASRVAFMKKNPRSFSAEVSMDSDKIKQVKDPKINAIWNYNEIPKGRALGRYRDAFGKLGRSRLLSQLKGPKAAIDHWNRYGKTTPLDRRRFNRKDLTAWRTKKLQDLVAFDEFVSGFLKDGFV